MSNAKDLAKNYPYADLDGNNTFSGANTFDGNAEFSLAPTYQGQVNLGLGMDQTWQDVFASRSSGVVYTNTTGRPLFVSVSCAGSVVDLRLSVDGSFSLSRSIHGDTSVSNETDTITFIIPDGSTYEFISSAGAIQTWWELR